MLRTIGHNTYLILAIILMLTFFGTVQYLTTVKLVKQSTINLGDYQIPLSVPIFLIFVIGLIIGGVITVKRSKRKRR